MAKKRKSEKRSQPRPSDAAHPSAAFTGPPDLLHCEWQWEKTKDGEGEELPIGEWIPVENCYVLAPGQTRGSETEWLAYFGEAEDTTQRHKMVLKHANICFGEHPFNGNDFKNKPATVVARWFWKAGMPVRPYTQPDFPGWRTHQDNENFQPRGKALGRARGGASTKKFFADARAEGAHYNPSRVRYAKGEASEPARRSFIAACKSDKLFRERGWTTLPNTLARLDALRRKFPRWPSPDVWVICGGCQRHLLDCLGDTRDEHCWETGDERITATGQWCNRGWLRVVDYLRKAGCGRAEIERFADRLRAFIGRRGDELPVPTTFLAPPAFPASGQAAVVAAPAALDGADTSTAAWTRARRQPSPYLVTPPRDDATRSAVEILYGDVETSHVLVELAEAVQIAFVAPALGASFEALVMPEGHVSGGALGVHGFSAALLKRAGARPFAEVWPQFLSWVEACQGEADVVVVGHNWREFDGPILARLAEAAGLPTLDFAVLDTLPLARRRQRRDHFEGDGVRPPRDKRRARGTAVTRAFRAGKVHPLRTGKNAHTLARLYHDATGQVLEGHHAAPADARALVPVLENLLAARGGTVDACVARFCAAERLRLAKNAGAADSAAAAADLAAAAAAADDDDDDDAPAPKRLRTDAAPAPPPRRRIGTGDAASEEDDDSEAAPPADADRAAVAAPPERPDDALLASIERLSVAAGDVLTEVAAFSSAAAPPAVDVDVSAYTPEQLAVLAGRVAGALKTQALAGRADRDALTLEVEEMELEHVKHLLEREQRDTSGDEETVRGRLIELLLEEPRE